MEHEIIQLYSNHGLRVRCLQHVPSRRPSGTPTETFLWRLATHATRFICQIAVGTKNGEIQVFDIASSSLLETISAHTGTLWSLHVRADGQTLVTGSADKDVKFWEFEQKPADNDNVCRFDCTHVLASS